MAVEINQPLTDIGHLSPLNQARYAHARLSYEDYRQAYAEHFQQLTTMSQTTIYAQGFDTFVTPEDLELFYVVVSAWKPSFGPVPTLAGMLIDAQWPEGVAVEELMQFRHRLEQHIKRSGYTAPEPVVPKEIEDPEVRAERLAQLNRDRVARHRALNKGIDPDDPVAMEIQGALRAAQANLKQGQVWRKQRLSELQEAKRAAKALADKAYHDEMVNINWHVSQAETQVSALRAQLDAHLIAKQ